LGERDSGVRETPLWRRKHASEHANAGTLRVKARRARQNLPPLRTLFLCILFLNLPTQETTLRIPIKMSSPSHRRQRSSQSSTPKRTSQRNAVPSSPPDPAAVQLHNEAASSQGNGTPRRAAPSSSPMNYRSSPADLARANRERDVSSPLRQMTNSQPTQDGNRTPRASASGLIGGKNTNMIKRSV
jgi:hypothetical protein